MGSNCCFCIFKTPIQIKSGVGTMSVLAFHSFEFPMNEKSPYFPIETSHSITHGVSPIVAANIDKKQLKCSANRNGKNAVKRHQNLDVWSVVGERSYIWVSIGSEENKSFWGILVHKFFAIMKNEWVNSFGGTSIKHCSELSSLTVITSAKVTAKHWKDHKHIK